MIEGVENDPSIQTAHEGGKKMQEFKPDRIISAGADMWLKNEPSFGVGQFIFHV
jgi:hypothetical protein